MPLVLEDGTGLAGANAYADRAYADPYLELRGVVTWAALSTAQRDVALVKATDYIETRWGPLFKGSPLTSTQALFFPAAFIYNRRGDSVVGVPERIKQATVMYALRATTADLMPDPEISDSGERISMKRERVGPIEEETQYSVFGSSIILIRPYPMADRLLSDLVRASGVNYR